MTHPQAVVPFTGPDFMEPSAKRFKGKARSTGDPTEEGEVRFRDVEAAARAVHLLDRAVFRGQTLAVSLDPNSQDGTKVMITNMPAGIAWQDLKDHFGQVGEVHYANIGRTVQEVGSVRGFGAALPGYPCVGEVRFANSDEAQNAQQMFNGRPFKGELLVVKPDLSSWHGTKLLVFNIPVGTDWPELKDHFEPAGQIQFCGIDCAVKGKGKTHGKGFPDGSWPPFVGGGPACGSGCSGGQTFVQQVYPQEVPSLDVPLVGEVRFENSAHTEQAISMLNGSCLGPNTMTVVRDGGCKDGSRVLVFGIPQGTPRHLLKEHFEQVGVVAFCGWKGKGGKGFGKDGCGKDLYGLGKDPFGGKEGYAFGGKDGCGYAGFGGKDGYGCGFGGGDGFGHAWQDVYGKDGYGKGGYQGVDPALACGVPGVMMPAGSMPGGPAGACGPVAEQRLVGEVRYLNPEEAGYAISLFNGSQLSGSTISVVQDGGCRDGSRVLIFNLPADIQRQNLQEYFEQVGTVAFCGWKGKGGKGHKGGGGPTLNSLGPAVSGVVVPPPGAYQQSFGAASTLVGEVAFESPAQAHTAMQMLEASSLRGSRISVQRSGSAPDGATLAVHGLPESCSAEELKGHFAQVGAAPYVAMHHASAGEGYGDAAGAYVAASLGSVATMHQQHQQPPPQQQQPQHMPPQMAAEALLETIMSGYGAAAAAQHQQQQQAHAASVVSGLS